MSRFFLKAKRSLDSLFNLINDLVPDGVLFFRLLSGRFAMCGDRTMFLFIFADQELDGTAVGDIQAQKALLQKRFGSSGWECPQILDALDVDYIDESEVLTPADHAYHVDKHAFRVPFVCGCRDLGEALRRISEGAAMIRTKGEAGTGDVVEAVRHVRTVNEGIARAKALSDEQVYAFAKEIGAPVELVREVRRLGRLPVVNFAAGGVATPADAALMMQLGCDGVFVGSGIFKSGDPAKRARAIVEAVTHYKDAKVLARVSENLGEAMVGISVSELPPDQVYAKRGW